MQSASFLRGLIVCKAYEDLSSWEAGNMQAKRTNIGIAMITNPRVLFLDEPTSGLDSYTAHEVLCYFHLTPKRSSLRINMQPFIGFLLSTACALADFALAGSC